MDAVLRDGHFHALCILGHEAEIAIGPRSNDAQRVRMAALRAA